jgi:hypothetical protein
MVKTKYASLKFRGENGTSPQETKARRQTNRHEIGIAAPEITMDINAARAEIGWPQSFSYTVNRTIWSGSL